MIVSDPATLAAEALRAPSAVRMRRASQTEVPVPPTATAGQGDRAKWAVMKIPDPSEADALQAVCQNSVLLCS